MALVAGTALVAAGSPADAATRYQVSTIGVGASPSAVGVDPGVHRAYVGNVEDDTVSVIDTSTHQVVGDPINLRTFAQSPAVNDVSSITVDPAAHRAYLTEAHAGTVVVIDTTTDAIVDHVYGGSSPQQLALDPGAHRGYVANAGDGSVTVLDTSSDQLVGSPIAVGGHPSGVALDPSTHRAFVPDLAADTVSVVNTSTSKVVGQPLSVGSRPKGVAVDKGVHRAYVANSGSASVSVIDTQTGAVVGDPVPVGQGPYAVSVDPGAHRAYVSNHDDDTVAVIDTTTDKIVGAPVPVGVDPEGIGIDTSTHAAYVANYDEDDYDAADTVSVISPDASTGITFTSTPPDSPRVGDTYQVSATTGFDGERVLLSIDPSSTSSCTIVDHGDSTGTVSLSGVGSCVVDADQAGSPTATQTLTVGRGQQAITFAPSDPGAHRVGTTYVVRATGGGSVKPVTFHRGGPSTDHPVCTIVDQGNGTARVTFTSPGQCIIIARQDGSTNYEPAPDARQSATSYRTTSIKAAAGAAAVYPGRHRLYLVGSNKVIVVDTNTNAVVSRIALGAQPLGVAVDTTSRQVYVTVPATDTVAVIDATTGKVVRRIPVGDAPAGVAVDPGTHHAYVTNADDDTVSVIDTTTNTVVGSPIAVGDHPTDVAVDSTTHRAYVVNDQVSGYVYVLNTLSDTVVGNAISVGVFPTGVAVDPGTHRAYVTKLAANSVAVIDTTTTTASRDEIPVGAYPLDIAVDPDLHRAYVVNGNDDTVSTIDTTTDTVVGSPIPVPDAQQVAVDRRTHRVYVTGGASTTTVIVSAAS